MLPLVAIAVLFALFVMPKRNVRIVATKAELGALAAENPPVLMLGVPAGMSAAQVGAALAANGLPVVYMRVTQELVDAMGGMFSAPQSLPLGAVVPMVVDITALTTTIAYPAGSKHMLAILSAEPPPVWTAPPGMTVSGAAHLQDL